jgi:hypothetical protein
VLQRGKNMFSYLDFLFKEEKSKSSDAKLFGYSESHWLQEKVRSSEIENQYKATYDEEQVNTAIVHTRQDIVLLTSMLNRTNILLRWIRFILFLLLFVVAYRFL